ncbi:nucleotidyltransferase family protein [Niallia sp. NCCP-28]|uniref:nucleotidyltransferase family protein n=1 Tax=Niallia sp. NCCP-28 TaxID=2934712 RepID=UPI00207DFAC3|nr:nucleotidyltransferase family protein [Niallia sp. NCCP-28]GKU81923.1 hypothetical protein NCCP28_13190 [Niallia sp. NCCP-28]
MSIKTKEDIIDIIKEDEWMMSVLAAVKTLDLPDCWVCAGFVRSKIWDVLHNFTDRTPLSDIDVIYFDENNLNKKREKDLEAQLNQVYPNLPWSVKNEARMHIVSKMPPYLSSVDAISKFPETATALGVQLDACDNVVLAAPCGIKDVITLTVKPTSYFMEDKTRASIYQKRMETKKWKEIWEGVQIVYPK